MRKRKINSDLKSPIREQKFIFLVTEQKLGNPQRQK